MAPKTVLVRTFHANLLNGSNLTNLQVTGANGHFGFRVVVSALQAGYKIRAVVCRQEAADQIKAAASIQPYLSNLEIVLVQDLLKEAAFDEAVIGMDFVIHVASPIMQQVSCSRVWLGFWLSVERLMIITMILNNQRGR